MTTLTRAWPAPSARFDVVVVGGGVTGVNVAREAAGRGLRTLLLERSDFGAGTSSATTKYIHGGLRYLEQRQLRVVRESLRERRLLGLGAPHLVLPRTFVLPAYLWSRPPAALLGAGVGLYEALSWDRNRDVPADRRVPRARWAGRREVLDRVPWLDRRELRGGFLFTDFLNVHPERLLLTLLRSAVLEGARALNHARVTGLLTEAPPAGDGGAGGRVVGVRVRDELDGTEREIRARVVVNAAGPWVGELLATLPGPARRRVRTSKGVHLLLHDLGGRDPVLARTRSGGHVVVSPWQGLSLVGPTDDEVTGPVDGVRADDADAGAVLDVLNGTLDPGVRPRTLDDVAWVTVGVRPLVVDAGSGSESGSESGSGSGSGSGEGVDSYRASRRAEWVDHGTGLWTVTGGKWTTGRATAAGLVTALTEGPRAPLRAVRPFDSTLVRPDPFGDRVALPAAELRASGLAPQSVDHLRRLYGSTAADVVAIAAARPELARRLGTRPGREDVAAQVVHAVTHESARTLADVVDRRLVLGTLGPPTRDELDAVVAVAAPLLGWDDAAAAAAVRERLDRDEAVLAALRPGSRDGSGGQSRRLAASQPATSSGRRGPTPT